MDGSTLHFIDSYHLLTYDELDSTNEEAKRLAQAGAQAGAVIWAKKQTSGKGRMGRSWVSDEGNLFFSVLLQPCASHADLPQLSFVTSLALALCLEQLIEPTDRLTLKWPNDILLDGKKLAGILLETVPVEENDARWVIIGIGVNIMSHPLETTYPATCLTSAGLEIISAKIVLARFLNFFEPLYDEWLESDFHEIAKRWMDKAAFIGEEVILLQDDREIHGVYEGIDQSGNILLTSKKNTIAYSAGDVHLKVSYATGH